MLAKEKKKKITLLLLLEFQFVMVTQNEMRTARKFYFVQPYRQLRSSEPSCLPNCFFSGYI